jgi:hypothetical protein
MKNSTGKKPRRHRLWVWILVIFGGLLVLGSILGPILWVRLLPGYVASNIRAKTGFPVQVASVSANPFTAKVLIRGLVLMNPDDWGGGDFVELREFRAQSSLFSLFSDRYLADEVVVNVAQVNLVKNKQGMLNALAFKDALTGGESGPSAKLGGKKGFFIKKLVLKFDKLTYDDRTSLLHHVRKYDLNINTELFDVDSVAKLASPFSGSAHNLVIDTMGKLFKGSTDLLMGTAGLLEDAGKETGKTLKGVLDSLDKKKP